MPKKLSHLVIRLLAAASVLFGAMVGAVVPVSSAAAQSDDDQVFHFTGGGFGHGVGMSQYGALGRAEAGHSYSEILEFYYHNTEVVTAPELVPDDVDVRVAIHNSTTFTPTGQLTVAMDGQFLDTTVNRLRVQRTSGGWSINSSNINWCGGFCPGTVLTVSFIDGEPVRVSNTANGTREYAHGQFTLTPADTGVPRCGNRSAHQYCLVIGGLTMQQYLYGIDEVPSRWHTEALKAQAIAARSYATGKIQQRINWGSPFDLYTSTYDQVYEAWDKESELHPNRPWADVVDATDDIVVTYTPLVTNEDSTSEPILDPETGLPVKRVVVAFYSSSNGGFTAASEESWSEPRPYLKPKPDPYDAALDIDGNPQNPLHLWYRPYTYDQVSRWLTQYTRANLDVGQIQEIHIENVGPSGRIDDALVTLVGSKRTLEVRDSDGDPFGYRFFYALRLGCRATSGCKTMPSTRVYIANGPPDDPTDESDFPVEIELDTDEDLSAQEGDLSSGNRLVESLPFDDVNPDAPYALAVAWQHYNRITLGTSDTKFSPDDPLTRAQFATFLWRFAGQPYTTFETGFLDVSADDVHRPGINWLVANNFTNGCNGDHFCPNEPLTMAHVASFLWRFAGRPYTTSNIPLADIIPGAYYEAPVNWMFDHNLWIDENFLSIGAQTEGLYPHQPITRARMSEFMWRLANAPDAFTHSATKPPLIRAF